MPKEWWAKVFAYAFIMLVCIYCILPTLLRVDDKWLKGEDLTGAPWYVKWLPATKINLGLDLSGKLSPATLEALAIVAYKQPVTRSEVDAVRGVQSDYVMRSLVSKGLIEEIGRLDQAGRPIIYGTTFEFLQHFGLTDLSELPPLEPDEFEIPALPQPEEAKE